MQDSMIIIRRAAYRSSNPGDPAECFTATVSGRFGGGFQGAIAGLDAESAARFAQELLARYGGPRTHQGRTYGYNLYAPQEVLDHLPGVHSRIPALA